MADVSGMVTVVQAAAYLTERGDTIDASNVSRYLARFREIPTRREGKFRFVDAVALKKHRDENVRVGDKRSARDIETIPDLPRPAPPRPILRDDDPEGETAAPVQSPIGEVNLAIKRLQLREAQLDMDEREGKLIAAHEVLAMISTVMRTFDENLVRAEVDVNQSQGREAAIAFRKARKDAQSKAAMQLRRLAAQFMPQNLVQGAGDAADADALVAAE